MQTYRINCYHLVSLRGLQPPEPPTEALPLDPTGSTAPQAPIISSRSALAMISPLALPDKGLGTCLWSFIRNASRIWNDGKAFYVLDIYHELVEKEDLRWIFITELNQLLQKYVQRSPLTSNQGQSPETPLRAKPRPGHLINSRSALAMISPPSLTV